MTVEVKYYLVDLEKIPPGFTKEGRLNAKNRIKNKVGIQGSKSSRSNTRTRLNSPPIYDEEGVLVDIGKKIIVRVHGSVLFNKQIAVSEISEELSVDGNLIEKWVEVTELTHEEALVTSSEFDNQGGN